MKASGVRAWSQKLTITTAEKTRREWEQLSEEAGGEGEEEEEEEPKVQTVPVTSQAIWWMKLKKIWLKKRSVSCYNFSILPCRTVHVNKSF